MLNKKRILIVVIILLLLIAGIVFCAKKFSKEKIDIGYRSNVNMVDIMAEKGIVGEDDLYVVAEEYDGRKSVTIKPSYLFEVAFLGIFQANESSSIENYNAKEIDNSYNEIKDTILVKDGGVIIPPKYQSKMLDIIKKYSNCNYFFDDKGYLKISDNENLSEFDKKVEEKINSNSNTIIISFDREYYSIDDVTGKVVTYPYCDLDPYNEYDVVRHSVYEIRFVNLDVDTISFLLN